MIGVSCVSEGSGEIVAACIQNWPEGSRLGL